MYFDSYRYTKYYAGHYAYVRKEITFFRSVASTKFINVLMLSGTSASAPLAAGIIALVLHASPNLNWRDVQHITVRCAHNANLRATDWSHNAVGRNFSHSFGYGIMDASCMVSYVTFNIQLQATFSYVRAHF